MTSSISKISLLTVLASCVVLSYSLTADSQELTALSLDPHCPYPSEIITYDYYPENCTAFYECDHGNRYLFNCGNGLEWNHIHNYCDYPENVDCSRGSTTTGASTTTGGSTPTTGAWTPDPQCPYPSEIITYDYYPGNCTAFYECDHGSRYLFNCGNGLEWNHVHNYCDYPENVDCSRGSTTTGASTTSGGSTPTTGAWTPDPHCPYPSEIITYDYYPGNCTAFYECDHGSRYLFNCGNGLEWNHVHNYCDYPENVDCSRASTTTVITVSTTKDPICSGKADGTFIADIHDCTKYYECVGGNAVQFTCPPNTVFNPNLNVCDYPDHVDCTPVLV